MPTNYKDYFYCKFEGMWIKKQDANIINGKARCPDCNRQLSTTRKLGKNKALKIKLMKQEIVI